MDRAGNSIFQALGSLIEYPDAGFHGRLELCRKALSEAHPALDVKALFNLGILPQERLEEVFTETFDVAPACILYVGIHLFGEESFKRGRFMAQLRQHFQELKFQPGSELPDHLGVLLCFLAHLETLVQKELVGMCLLSPLQKMIGALGENNPYRAILELIRDLLKVEFPEVAAAPLPVEETKTHLVGTEMLPGNHGRCHSGFTLPLGLPESSDPGRGQANIAAEDKPPAVVTRYD